MATTRSDDSMRFASDAPPPPEASRVRVTSTRVKWGLAGVAAAGCAYVALVDPNQSSIYPQCPFRALSGYDCPGCGITRALHSTLHGNIVGAANHNLLAVLIAVVAVLWFVWARVHRRRGGELPRFSLSPGVTVALGVVVVAFWVLRNLPMQPFHWLNSAA